MLLQETVMMVNSWRRNGLNRIVRHQGILCSYPSLCITYPRTNILLVWYRHKPVKNILFRRQDNTAGYETTMYKEQWLP